MNSFHTRTLVAYNPVPGDKGADLVPDLATNTGIPSNQAKTWKFTLRPGTTFEDGVAILNDAFLKILTNIESLDPSVPSGTSTVRLSGFFLLIKTVEDIANTTMIPIDI